MIFADDQKLEQLFHHPLFQENLTRIQLAEQNRRFCRHNLEHSLDVARLMWIAVLEQQFPYDRAVVYACGLLHDACV